MLPEQENALLAHLRHEGLTEEEITAGRVAFPVGFEVYARTGEYPAAAEFRALIARKDAPPTIRFDGGMHYHKAVRALTEDEFDALRADIERDGKIYAPILIDRYGNIIDGAHRARSAVSWGSMYRSRSSRPAPLNWQRSRSG